MKQKTKSHTDIDFWLIFRPFLEPKSLQNRFQSGFGRALNEDSVSKLKKERARFSTGAPGSSKMKILGAQKRVVRGSTVASHA